MSPMGKEGTESTKWFLPIAINKKTAGTLPVSPQQGPPKGGWHGLEHFARPSPSTSIYRRWPLLASCACEAQPLHPHHFYTPGWVRGLGRGRACPLTEAPVSTAWFSWKPSWPACAVPVSQPTVCYTGRTPWCPHSEWALPFYPLPCRNLWLEHHPTPIPAKWSQLPWKGFCPTHLRRGAHHGPRVWVCTYAFEPKWLLLCGCHFKRYTVTELE